MDRTEASDAFNAGSIPVGCIFIFFRIALQIMERYGDSYAEPKGDKGRSTRK